MGIFIFHSHTEDTSLKGLKEVVSNWSYITCCCNIKLKLGKRKESYFNCTYIYICAHNNIAEVGLKVLRLCKTSTRLGGLNSLSTPIASRTKTYSLKTV